MKVNITSLLISPLRKFGRKFTGLMLLALSLFLGFIMIATGPSAEPLEKTERAWPITVITAAPTDLPPTLLTFGKVESKQVASLNTNISAPVSEVLVREGDWVEEDELLIQVDANEGELNLNVAQANYDRNSALLASVRTEFELANSLSAQYQQLNEIAESKLSRAVDLNSRNMISDAQLDEARQEASQTSIALQQHMAQVADFPNKIAQQQASVAESGAYLQRAKLDLQQTQIRAPFAGRVISSNVSKGDRVIAGATLIRIADYSGLEVRTSVPTEVGYLLSHAMRNEQLVQAKATLDDRDLVFVLDRLSADIKPGQSGIDVFFRSDAGEALDIGRVVNLSVNLPVEENVISMPVHALYENQTIYRIKEQRLEAINYERVGDYLGNDDEFSILIRSSEIKAGDQLLGSQLSRAITGLLVEPISGTL